VSKKPITYSSYRRKIVSKELETKHPFNAPSLGENFVLKIRTSKSNGRLSSVATVVEERGSFVTYRVFHDYYRIVINGGNKRATQKAIDTQHQEALEMLDTITADALSHYAEIAAKEVA
jgi:hypothetical protein